MYVVEVIPITRGGLSGSLSFFSKIEVPVGSIVSAPVRGRMVPALVTGARDARSDKLDLKAAAFSLKKLGVAAPRILFSASAIAALHECADYFVSTTGALLTELTFTSLLTSARSLSAPETETPPSVTPEVQTLQAEYTERVQTYRNIVRECFARKRSAIIIAPTLVEVERLATELRRGIEDQVYTASSAEKQTALRRAWESVAKHSGPTLLIGTPPALLFPTKQLDTILIERESARAYVTRGHSPLDIRKVAEILARARGARCVLADFPLRTETYARRELDSAEEYARPQVRTVSTARITITDARKTDSTRSQKRNFSTLEPHTYEALSDTVARGGKCVIYAARKGIAPLTVCNDCGTPVSDPATGTPMVLTKTPGGNVFVSRRTGAILSAERACATCGGWNLVSLGIGVDRVAEELKKKNPNLTPLLFTADTVKTHAAAMRLMSVFTNDPHAVLVGTERMLPYVPQVALSIVASIDSVLSLPSWRAHEHALGTLFTLLSRTDEQCIIETRKPDALVLQSIASGSPIEFLREEIKERKFYGYPPFATFIGLTWHGSEAECVRLSEVVRQQMSAQDLVGPLPPEEVGRASFRARAVVRCEPGAWPDASLITSLRALPPSISITVDPDDIV